MNNLHMYKELVKDVISRYDKDDKSFELLSIKTFLDNINDEHIKNKKDAREEFKTEKKNC